jgi:hypothetical protein
VIVLLVALALGGMGYLAYLKQHPNAQPSAVERWARSGEAEKLLPGLLFACLGGGVVAVGVGGYRRHRRSDLVWSEFAAQLGFPCENAAFFAADPSRIQGELEGRAFSLETRTEAVLDNLREQGYKLEKGYLIHSSPEKTSPSEELRARLARLSSFAKQLEVEAAQGSGALVRPT